MQRLPTAIEDALHAWVSAIHPDATAIWAAEDGQRPPAPFARLDVIAGPATIGPPEERYKDTDTYTYAIRKLCTVNVQVFGEDALMRAGRVVDALSLPSRQALLQSAGIAVWDSEGPRDITALMDTRHEGRATLDLFISYPDPVDDAPGEIRRVHVTGGIDAITVDRTIDA